MAMVHLTSLLQHYLLTVSTTAFHVPLASSAQRSFELTFVSPAADGDGDLVSITKAAMNDSL